MGRHRRSGAAPAAEDLSAGADRRHRGARRGRSVRTGLLGASAAVAVGAVAVASGLLPGGDTFTVGGPGTAAEHQARSRQAPQLTTQGGATETPAGTDGSPSARPGARTGTGTSGTSASPATPSATPSGKPAPATTSPEPARTSAPAPAPKTATAKPKTAEPKPVKPKPARTAGAKPAPKAAPSTKAPAPKPDPTAESPLRTASTAGRADAAEAEVLRLVNAERARVGCVPVRADARLASLAGAFSADMAARGFFDHTDPDGDTPWARAQKAGVSTLAGENIARGQVDAAAVMESWMNSDGHRANILNCDFKAMGVGVHFGDGGPWWTEDFGY
ncbi:CAP domain-containing protein [Streptomyces sp. NPDC001744]|uniref:CAP domain-containing protein n=1 Tax=Streptomyces sp. NPDC001744 TaxID=3364606 RepID=UPI0036B19564